MNLLPTLWSASALRYKRIVINFTVTAVGGDGVSGCDVRDMRNSILTRTAPFGQVTKAREVNMLPYAAYVTSEPGVNCSLDGGCGTHTGRWFQCLS